LAFAYIGPDAAEMHFVQFVWFKSVATVKEDGKYTDKPITDPDVKLAGVAINLPITTEPDNPDKRKVEVDTGGKTDPDVLSATAMGGYTSHGLIWADMPNAASSANQVIATDFRPRGATSIKTIVYFSTYLIYKGRPVYRIDWTNEARFQLENPEELIRRGEPNNEDSYRAYGGASKDLKLTPAEIKALQQRFPNQTMVNVNP
jgi:hypothetical protein